MAGIGSEVADHGAALGRPQQCSTRVVNIPLQPDVLVSFPWERQPVGIRECPTRAQVRCFLPIARGVIVNTGQVGTQNPPLALKQHGLEGYSRAIDCDMNVRKSHGPAGHA